MQKNQVFQLVLAIFFVTVLFPVASFAVVPFDLQSQGVFRSARVTINGGDTRTRTRSVVLSFTKGTADVESMRIANSPEIGNVSWQPYSSRKEWFLDFGRGEKVVYVQFRRTNGDISTTFSDAIILDVDPQPFIEMTVNDGDDSTFDRTVTVSSTVSEGVEHMQISNSSDFSDVPWLPVQESLRWSLPTGEGKKTVYVRYRDAQGRTFIKKQSIIVVPFGQLLEAGDIVTSPGDSIYYYGFDGELHDYPSLAVFHTWFDDFDFGDIVYVSNVELSQYPVGESVSPRPGSWLVRFGVDSQEVFAVEPGYVLRPFLSEIEKELLYGLDWKKRVITINQAERVHYTLRSFSEAIASGATDEDGDGLDSDLERRYGSSDTKVDSDGDGLSDLEEIRFLSSDPGVVDSNGNGIADGAMVRSGKLPTGGALTTLPEHTYSYARGTVVSNPDGKGLYFFSSDGKLRAMSSQIYRTDPTVSGFIVYPPYPILIGRTSTMSRDDGYTYAYPTRYRQGKIERL